MFRRGHFLFRVLIASFLTSSRTALIFKIFLLCRSAKPLKSYDKLKTWTEKGGNLLGRLPWSPFVCLTPTPLYVMSPQLQSTRHYIVDQNVNVLHMHLWLQIICIHQTGGRNEKIHKLYERRLQILCTRLAAGGTNGKDPNLVLYNHCFLCTSHIHQSLSFC